MFLWCARGLPPPSQFYCTSAPIQQLPTFKHYHVHSSYQISHNNASPLSSTKPFLSFLPTSLISLIYKSHLSIHCRSLAFFIYQSITPKLLNTGELLCRMYCSSEYPIGKLSSGNNCVTYISVQYLPSMCVVSKNISFYYVQSYMFCTIKYASKIKVVASM